MKNEVPRGHNGPGLWPLPDLTNPGRAVCCTVPSLVSTVFFRLHEYTSQAFYLINSKHHPKKHACNLNRITLISRNLTSMETCIWMKQGKTIRQNKHRQVL